MMWENSPDCHNELVAQKVRRDQVDAVLQCLHFRNNDHADGDSYYKVRPIFENLNRASAKWMAMESQYSIDEMMIPYYGRHSSKQFIRGKPIRYGFKVWALCTSCGAGVWYEPYCGRDTCIEDQGLGQGPNVVLDLIEKAGLPQGSEIYMDNVFTTFPLLEKLSERGIGGTGTVRQNRLNKVPIMKKKQVEKKDVPRGFSQSLFQEDRVLIVWKDNKAVYMASNKHGDDKSGTCLRFSREKKANIQVPMPTMVGKYNAGMGGVDLLDNLIACYRPVFRIRKWWFAFFTWSISLSAVNAWRFRMQVTGKKEAYLDFLRELVVTMLQFHGSPPLASGPKKISAGSRFDGLNHWITSTAEAATGKSSRRNCKQCHLEGKKEAKAVFICRKCDVPLHVQCFEELHCLFF